MNQSSLKTFAQDARNKLRQLIGARLDYVLSADSAELRQQAAQVNELRAALKAEGRDPLIERVAYTWFNRLAALRFMDANGYHPFGARVITPATANETLPELLQQARAGALDADFAAQPLSSSPGRPVSSSQSLPLSDAIAALLSGRIPVDHPEAQVFKLLLVAACNYYHRLMPFLFEKIGDATELLLLEDLLSEHSIVADFREYLTDEDCRNEEVLGWFYQYYISEKKDEVMARNAAVPKQDIPAVTQLFTPHWIVRYLVENSLGRLWLLNRPHSKLREKMPYFIDDSETLRPGEGETVGPGDRATRRQGDELPGLRVTESQSHTVDFLRVNRPEEIKLLDPAAGSGHMLTYAFDLLYAIYEEEGYDAPEIPGLILRHNLYGVDICDRAVALAAFALCMKARARDRRFFTRTVKRDGATGRPGDGATSPQVSLSQSPNVIALQEIRFEEGELREYIRALNLGDLFNQPMLKLLHQFEEAKNLGALIQPCLDEAGIAFARRAIEAKDLGGQLFLRETHAKVLRVLEQSEYLSQRYHVVVANPPYMGNRTTNQVIKEYAAQHYPNSKLDLFAMFMERAQKLAVEHGWISMITMQGWMFLTVYSDLRSSLLRTSRICTLAHLGPHAFDSIGGEVVQTVAFAICNTAPCSSATPIFIRAVGGESEAEKNQIILSGTNRFRVRQKSFESLPGKALMFWLPEKILSCFANPAVRSITVGEGKNVTSDNARFVRFQWEVSARSVGRRNKWLSYAKGGPFRKWWGNLIHVVDWSPAARQFYRDYEVARIIPEELWYRAGVTWTDIASSGLGFRLLPEGGTFDATGLTLFPIDDVGLWKLLGLLNTTFSTTILPVLNPTVHVQLIDVKALPLPNESVPPSFQDIVQKAVSLARADWDNFETSWDFRDLPVLRPGLKGATLGASWQNWKAHCAAAIRRMQELETENNRLFIAAYGLQDELAPEVPEDQITLARADMRKDMAAFLSYAVGCMFGRYSLDAPGLVLADAGATVADYDRIMAEKTLRQCDGETVRQGDQASGLPVALSQSPNVASSQSHPVSKSSTPLPSSQSLPVAKSQSPKFHPDEDGILPVLDGEWFQDDIVGRFREFLRVTYGEENLAENLAFIEASLGKLDAKTGKAKPTDLQTYFVRDFYKEHLKTYKKRPIYWMFSSPEGSFQALIYLHRYTRDTVNLLLNDYVREFLGKLEEKHRQLTAVTLNESARPGDRTKAAKELGKIDKMLKEIRTWERDVLLPLAQQRIELDLDDGVKVNYLKFKGAVVPIPGLEKQEDEP